MRKSLIYILLILAPLSMGAQALPFTAADYNPATLAKGGASATETSSVAYTAFANPAAIAFYDGTMDVSAGYTLWQPNSVKTSVATAGGAMKIGNHLGIALGLSLGVYPEYPTVGITGNETGTFKPGNMQAGLGLSYKIIPGLSVGANIGYATEKLSEEVSYGALDADIYAMVKFGGLKAALGVSEIGGKVTSASGATFSLPSTATIGVGYTLTAAEKHTVDINADSKYYFTGGIAATAGASYTYDGMVSVRAGYRYGGDSVIPSFASVGAGVRLFGARLDLAYVFGNKVMANTLALSLGYSF